jgi:hypothetical protein
VRSSLAGRDNSPDTHGDSEKQRRSDSGEKEVRGELHEEVSDEEDAGREVKVGPRHSEILFEGAEPSLREVAAKID